MASAKTRPSPVQDFAACVSHAEGVEATVDYLVPGSRINRRYVAPGAELNTGRYAPHTVFIRNGRFCDPRVQNAAPRESIEFRTIAYYL